jgi:NADH-quinone oxidoreductase subunit F
MITEKYPELEKIIEEQGREKRAVIPILQAIQARYNFLPEEALKIVCEKTEIPPDLILGVASFYNHFRLKPAGKHIVKVCTGTACHVKRSELVFDEFGRTLGLEKGLNTDKNGNYTLERVNCLGCCTLAPVVLIDDITYGHVDIEGVHHALRAFELEKNKKQQKPLLVKHKNDLQGEIRVGLGSCCVASGSEEVKKSVENAVWSNELNVRLKQVGCVGKSRSFMPTCKRRM